MVDGLIHEFRAAKLGEHVIVDQLDALNSVTGSATGSCALIRCRYLVRHR